MILQLLQNQYRAPFYLPDGGHLSMLITFSIFLFLFSLYLLYIPHLCPLSPFLHAPFLDCFSLYVSFFHQALLFSDTLNQGVIDNVSASLSISSNSLTLSVFVTASFSLISWAMQEAILSPQFHPSIITKMSTPRSHPRKDKIPEHFLYPPRLTLLILCNTSLQVYKKASPGLSSFLRLYMEEKILISAHSVCTILCLFWTWFSWDHAEVPWKLQK